MTNTAEWPRPKENITSLIVTAKIAGDLFAGTSDTISIAFGQPRGGRHELFSNPSRGAKVDLPIHPNTTFGKSAISLADLTYVSLYQHPTPHPIASDDWKLESLVFTANGKYKNHAFQNINKWLKNPASSSNPVWEATIPWGSWLAHDQRPIDLSLTTYPVGWIPYIADLRGWRDYNPANLDGVGQLLGVIDGKLIGDLLKTRQCAELAPNLPHNSYTWVFTPGGSIIYKLWDHDDRHDYVRHSQLGSGEPVICAGEMRIAHSKDTWTLESVVAMVNDASGHYKPDGGACLQHVHKKLTELGIPTKETQWFWREK